MNEEQIEQIIDSLNSYATDYNGFDSYGLPTFDDVAYEEMKKIVRNIMG